MPAIPDHHTTQSKPDTVVGIEISAVLEYQPGAEIIGGIAVAAHVGDGAFFAQDNGSFGRICPGQGNGGLYVRRLPYQVVAILVVIAPFTVWFIGVYQFADTFQTVEVLFGFGECPTRFKQNTKTTNIVQGVGSGNSLVESQYVACVIVLVAKVIFYSQVI